MYNYSKGELEAMSATFAHHFKVDKELTKTAVLHDWMTDSPVAIVEYDGYLNKEKAADRDRRMEIVEVYDGQIADLVSYLRYLYPEKKSLAKWALIFEVHNELMDVQKSIEQAKLQTVFGTSDGSDEAPHEEEVVQEVPETSNEEMHEVKAEQKEEVHEEVAKVTEVESTPVQAPTMKDEVPSVNHGEVFNTPVADDDNSTPSGNVQKVDEPLLSNKTNKMEEHTMSDIDELLKAAQGSAPAANPGEVQKAPTANTSAVKADMKAAQMAVSAALASQKEQRDAWTRSNVVTDLISTQQPAAMRRTADEGTVGTETDPTKLAEAINGKLLGFIASVTGKKGLTVDQFEALAESERYVNVVPGSQKYNDIEVSNVDKAKAIYTLLKQVKQNPTQPVAAMIPSKLSYPIKGYCVAGKGMPADEFMVLLADNSNGAIYAQGGVNENGVEVEGACSFKLATAKKAERAQAQAITTQKVEKRVPVIRVKNKSNFIQNGQHVVYLFQSVDPDNMGRAAFRAAINVNGAMVPAGVTVYALDDQGQRQVISHNDKDNTDRYKTKQASVSVSVPVKKVLKEFAPEFKGDDDTLVAAGRWGVPMGSGKSATGDFCNIKEFSQSPAFDVFAQCYAGNLTLSGKMKESETLRQLRAAADQAAAAEAQEAAEALN